jgi:hypothetical protein
MKIIGIAGQKGAGKDTVADFFVQSEKFTKLAFADSLKELCSRLFDIPIDSFNDRKIKDTEFDVAPALTLARLDKMLDIVQNEWEFEIDDVNRDKILDYVDREFDSPRHILQTIGTMLRNYVREDIWIILLCKKMKECSSNVVVSDVRLANERKALKAAGAKLMLVKRPILVESERTVDSHISENDFGKDDEYDVQVLNDKIGLTQLRAEVLLWYSVAWKNK